jgi:hypothetical protein
LAAKRAKRIIFPSTPDGEQISSISALTTLPVHGDSNHKLKDNNDKDAFSLPKDILFIKDFKRDNQNSRKFQVSNLII